MINLKGLGVALITPFDKNNDVDFIALEKVINHIKKDIDYLIVFGTTSEAPTLTEKEKAEILKKIKSLYADHIILGIGGYNTKEVIEKIKSQDFKQIDAILSVAPYYNKPNQKGLIAHFEAIANNSPVPIVLYNVPSRTSSNLEAATTLKLAQHPNIIAIKEASGNFAQIMKIMQNKPDDFVVVSGDDALTLPLMSIGVEGLISVIGNAYPKITRNIVKSILKGDLHNAQKFHYKLLPLIEAIFKEGNPAGIKALLSIKGLIQNNLRLPLVPVSNNLVEEIKNIIKHI